MTVPVTVYHRIRKRISVRGIVQGVGFRPFVYRLAGQHHLTGFVGNDGDGVFLEVEGDAPAIEAFVNAIQAHPPPLAHIEQIDIANLTVQGDRDFIIVDSRPGADAYTLVSPDLCICDDCLAELLDPPNRRYRYPFINCINCGPRFTIVKDVPYDRPVTTMAEFTMCPACQAEYTDPLNRRFHAQPNACADCGPQVTFVTDDITVTRDAAVTHALKALENGQIVAIKGIGGFHLACDARNEATVQRLRAGKGRQDKPFALMVRDLDMARELAYINEAEAQRLRSPERPIVLVRHKRPLLSRYIAPGNNYVGVMLPYTPLHYLLVHFPMVMTSANYTSEPIVIDNDDALSKLAQVADAFLLHDRPIHVHCDDSVVRVFRNADYPMRRSRGYAPFPVKLPVASGQILAVGGELKSTFCVSKGHDAFVSQHIGDMENLETLDAFERAYQHMSKLFRLRPELVACDQHPRYLSAQWAERFAAEQGIPLLKVQHHHAHIAAVMAENGLTEPVIGFSYDGTGYGDDGAIWGGELLIADYQTYHRVSHLPYMPLPGGDHAVKNPYRLALAYLWANDIPWDNRLAPVRHATDVEKRILQQQLERQLNLVNTSSMGRLFDVVAALIGIRQTISYEGQAAIEMEAIAAETCDAYRFDSIGLLLSEIVADILNQLSAAEIAGKFHQTIAKHIMALSEAARLEYGLSRVALSGGVFQNITLLQLVTKLLQDQHFEVFVHRQVPTNDAGLALGQAIIAGQTLKTKGENECV